MKHYYNVDHLPVIMSNTRVAFLIMLHSHEQDHGNRDITYSISMHEAWIVGGRRLAAKIKSLCVRCRYLDKKLAGQKMAILPQELAVPCPPWTNVGLDLAGPMRVRIVGGGKTTRKNTGTFKGWVVIIVCLNTKAVKLYLACGYSTMDFMLVWDQHISDCGIPALVHSDRGSQLVSASKEVVDAPEYNWDEISRNTENKTTWRFCPAGSQFRNGASEIFVKKMKRTLIHTYGDKSLNQQELITALKKTANILNSRPIYAMMGPCGGADPDYLQVLTPNMLLLGRANSELPVKNYEDVDEPMVRLAYVSELLRLWWGQHYVQDFSSLVPTQKWWEVKRNIRQGDIVLIQYTSMAKVGDYRLGRVIAVEVDDDGLVRTCIVKYKIIKDLPADRMKNYEGITNKFIRVAVQRLVIIVPREEQEHWPGISDEDSRVAKNMIDEAKRTHKPRQSTDHNVNISILSNLQKREELDQIWGKIVNTNWDSIEYHDKKEDTMTDIVRNQDVTIFTIRDYIERPYLFFD